MFLQNTDIPKEVLLAVGGIIIFLVFGCYYLIGTIPAPIDSNVTEVLPAELQGKTSFEKGQYYFNSDDKEGGEYDIKKAQQYYEEEIAQNPKGNKLVWYQSGRIDFINGNFDTALQKFATQIAYFGDEVPNVYYMIGLTYGYKARQTNNQEDWKQAEDNFIKAVAFFNKAPWPYVDLAWIYFSQGKFQEMKPVVEEGLSVDSNNPWLLNMYGLALFNTGDTKLAGEYFIFAQEMAEKLTVEQWGKSYPGNNPEIWGKGLSEFKEMIAKNRALTE
jgi:tetratricopeptide (TPR) repeat protein